MIEKNIDALLKDLKENIINLLKKYDDGTNPKIKLIYFIKLQRIKTKKDKEKLK